MAPIFNNNSSPSSLYFLTMLIVLLSRSVMAQSLPPTSDSSSQYDYFGHQNLTSSMMIIVILIITLFFLFGFISVYIRQCAGEQMLGVGHNIQTPTLNRQPKGLDPAIIAKFPIMVYSEVKEHKIGKRALECAVCLSEFEDNEKLRLLPKCSHVFHPDCIDAWLSGHVTCPVCRCNLTNSKIGDTHTPMSPNPDATVGGNDSMLETTIAPNQQAEETSVRPVSLPADAVVLEVKPETGEEVTELERIRTIRRAMKSKSNWRPPRFPRSNSTGHSLSSLPQTAEDPQRYTLKLPDQVLRRIIAEGKLRRCSSSSELALKMDGEGSSRGGRSIRMFVRDLSERVSAWGMGKRGDADGLSVRGGGSTVRGRLESVKVELESRPN